MYTIPFLIITNLILLIKKAYSLLSKSNKSFDTLFNSDEILLENIAMRFKRTEGVD